MPEMINNLTEQNLETLDVSKLTPITPEVISRQATINIGTIGHVAHGKSTVVKALTGVHTVRFKNERERNITIKLGYANAKIYKCNQCPRPSCYTSAGSNKADEFRCQRTGCEGTCKLLRHVSFVDCPGHEVLMATMLNGAAIMDAGLLLVAANEHCPQPQTAEHLAAIEIMKLKDVIILQNKIDLVGKVDALAQKKAIIEFMKGTVAEKSPIIPISAELKLNMDVLCEYLVEKIPLPIRDFTSDVRMVVIRSFDVNKPGCTIDELKGGVAGGSLLKGVLKLGQEIEVRPGVVTRDADGQFSCRPIFSKVVSLFTEQNQLEYAVPGGLIGVGTKIDPELCRADRLGWTTDGAAGSLPKIYSALDINTRLMKTLLGIRIENENGVAGKIKKLELNEIVLINIGSLGTGATITSIKKDFARFRLNVPVCTYVGERVTLSRKSGRQWRLIGWGEIVKGSEIKPII